MRKPNHYLRFLSGATVMLLSFPSGAMANQNMAHNHRNLTPKINQSRLIAQALENNNGEVLIPNPSIRIDGKPLQRSEPIPPPFLPRAVAPPVGDMAVSNINNTSPKLVELGTTTLVPRLVLREAPVREVLSLLSRAAGLNLVFTDNTATTTGVNDTVSLDLENEPIDDVFNWVLAISGLNASRKGNTIFVGADLPFAARNLITRSIRMNQYPIIGAAEFLGSQGASVKVVDVEEEGEGENKKITFTPKEVYIAEAAGEKLILRGLTVHGDEINNNIVLIGPPHLVEIATSFLIQLDVRRRQVAVNVKVVDVQLNNDYSFGSSFSFGIDDTGVVQDSGVGVINFGTSDINLRDFPPGEQGVPNPGEISPFGTSASGDVIDVLSGTESPFDFNVPNAFLLQLRATIESGNAKILTDPTLVVQEGQVASVELVENVVTSITTTIDGESGTRTVTPVIEPAGLTLDVDIQKIDDNGYIALVTNPVVSAPGEEQSFDSGAGAVNTIRPLIERRLSSGLIRLRDGQTLILSGIISEAQRTISGKVPILGDLPLLGSLFRFTRNQTERTEVIVLLTPQILNDSEAYSGFGYNYTPSRETGEFLRDQGLTVPSTP
jgi:type IV pilus assembly protein PilQ